MIVEYVCTGIFVAANSTDHWNKLEKQSWKKYILHVGKIFVVNTDYNLSSDVFFALLDWAADSDMTKAFQGCSQSQCPPIIKCSSEKR